MGSCQRGGAREDGLFVKKKKIVVIFFAFMALPSLPFLLHETDRRESVHVNVYSCHGVLYTEIRAFVN